SSGSTRACRRSPRRRRMPSRRTCRSARRRPRCAPPRRRPRGRTSARRQPRRRPPARPEDGPVVDLAEARRWIAEREEALRERLGDVERRLAEVRSARAEWTDEEHDPEGFTLTFEWQQAEGARN